MTEFTTNAPLLTVSLMDNANGFIRTANSGNSISMSTVRSLATTSLTLKTANLNSSTTEQKEAETVFNTNGIQMDNYLANAPFLMVKRQANAKNIGKTVTLN